MRYSVGYLAFGSLVTSILGSEPATRTDPRDAVTLVWIITKERVMRATVRKQGC